MIEIKKIGSESIGIIQSLAQLIWPVTYKDIISAAQMEYMLDKIYSTESLHNQIENLDHQFILVLDDDKAIAFASCSVKSPETPALFRLHKIYISPGQQGKGVGKLMLDYLVNDIKPKGATALELNVNRHNPAFHFYTKVGFVILKEEDLDIGNGYFMNDYVMLLAL